MKLSNLLIALSCVAIPAAGKLPHLAESHQALNTADWRQIRAEYERHRHGFFSNGTRHDARNFEQQWLSRFDGQGFTAKPDDGAWSWGLELAGMGAKPRVTAEVNRLTYRWSAELEEWFVNDRRGLEHGFTLRTRQEIRLKVRGGLRARLKGTGVEFVDGAGVARVRYSELAAWDADGRSLPARFQVDGGSIGLVVDDREARYPITVDPIAQQAYLKASNTSGSTYFGRALAVSGDTVVVGAYWEDSSATGVNGNQADTSALDSGAAYVFVRNGSVWSQQAYLKASNTGAGDQFGSAVGISGDTIVVGASGEASNATGVNGNQANNSAPGAGAAYVFVRAGTTWTQQAYLKASNAGALDIFGHAAAISGDTIVVGADAEDSNATGVNGNQADDTASASGAAYVFVRNGTTWSQQAYLKASNTGLGDRFGYSVSVSDDTVVVGAYFEDSNATGVNGNQANNSALDSGAAYVFTRSGTTWAQEAYLKASNAEAFDFFGFSVAVSGDTVVVGAYLEDSSSTGVNGSQIDTSATNSGAAYVYFRSGRVWAQQAYLKPTNTIGVEFFGWSVAIAGDAVVVGASGESGSSPGVNGDQLNRGAPSGGAAYTFVRTGAAWAPYAYLKASNVQSGDLFGVGVAVSGEIVVVGAEGEASSANGVNGNQLDNTRPYSGAAYAFAGLPNTTDVTIASSPTGLVFGVSGTGCGPGSGYTTPKTFSWTAGSTCTVSFSTPQSVSGAQYAFSRWEDNSTNAVRVIVAPAVPVTYTATFDAPSASITSPSPGSVLPSPSATFTWSALSGAQGYWLDVGTVQGSGNLCASGALIPLTYACNAIPVSGATIYVSLFTRDSGGNWLPPKQYTYVAPVAGAQPPQITSPAPGSALSGSTVTFQWTARSGATDYWLDVGTALGQGNVCASGAIAATSFSCPGIPTTATASVIHAQVWALAGGVWLTPNRFTFTPPAPANDPQITSPAPGSTLIGSTVTFQWTARSGATNYWLDVGTALGQGNICASGAIAGTSFTCSGIAGATIHAQVWALVGGVWLTPNRFTFAPPAPASDPQITSPAPGSTLSGSTVTFQWTARSGATNYWLDVGTALGQGNICASGAIAATSFTCSGIAGATIHAQVWALVGGVWLSPNRFTFLPPAANDPQITSPAPGSTLSASTVIFQWTARAGATNYWLDVGTAVGQGNICASGAIAATSFTCSGIAGATIHAQVWALVGGVWLSPNRFTFVPPSANDPQITSPAPGSTLSGSTVTFQWTARTGATNYWLDVGTAVGQGNICASGAIAGTSFTCSGIAGATIHSQVWALVGGVWLSPNRFTFLAPTGNAPQITSPAPGSQLTSTTVTFQWTALSGATNYWLDVGTALGQGNICASGAISATSFTCSGIPIGSGGSIIHAQVWSLVGGTWQSPNRFTFLP